MNPFGYSVFRRSPKRLPGSLCDETPRAEAGKWQPRDDGDWATGSVTDTVRQELATLLAERDAETQRADRAETALRDAKARISGLELTITAMSQPRAAAMRIADEELLVQPLAGKPDAQ